MHLTDKFKQLHSDMERNQVNQRDLDKCYKTSWFLSHKLRIAMVDIQREKLSGLVEFDETYVGGESSGTRDRGAANKIIIAIAYEIKEKSLERIRLQVIKDCSAKSLDEFIDNNISKGSTVKTDAWSGYCNVKDNGFAHTVVNIKVKITRSQ
jgi:transposase-like protein